MIFKVNQSIKYYYKYKKCVFRNRVDVSRRSVNVLSIKYVYIYVVGMHRRPTNKKM